MNFPQDLKILQLQINVAQQLIEQENFTSQQTPLYTEEQIQELCLGKVANCFGKEFAIYDNGTVKASRLPNGDLNFVTRVIRIKGERHQIKAGATIVAEYDVPTHPWFYQQNPSDTIPYSVLMEMGLQPCGFLSAHLGTTLIYSDRSLYFRNLDGWGVLVKNIDIRGKTITNNSTLISSTKIQGIILQSFSFQLACEGEIFYQGEASFGHFSPEALANQVGLDQGKYILPWYERENHLNLPAIEINLRNRENSYYQLNPSQPHYRLAQEQLNFLDQAMVIAQGGKYGQGYIYATKEVLPTDWYFDCHFYQDPVMPGSLGVEAMIQAMQIYALHFNLGKNLRSPRFMPLVDYKTVWKYRGQILPDESPMSVEVHLTRIKIDSQRVILIADASLWKPNLRIYEVKDIALALTSS